jgi:MFS family permease
MPATQEPGVYPAPQRPESALAYGLGLSILFLVILCLAYSINAADRQIFPTLLPAIRKTFGFNLEIAGLLSTIFTLGLMVSGIPSGYLTDRTSRKTVIVLGMVIYSIFTLATIYAHGFWDMLFYRAMTGVGEGIQMAGLFAAIGSYFHYRRSFYIGWLILSYGVGAFVGPRAGAILTQSAAFKNPATAATAWHIPFVWFTVAGFAIAFIVLVGLPKKFSESKGPAATTAVDQAAIAHMPTNLWNRNVIMGFIGCVILGYSLYGYIGLYTTYLKDSLKYTPMAAAGALSFFGLGGFCSFIGGWCGDRFSQRWVTAVAFACLAAVGYSMYNVATGAGAQGVLSFLTGALGSGFVFVNLLSMLQRSVRPAMVGRASGIFLTAFFGSGATAGYLMGFLVTRVGWGHAALIELTLFPIIGIIAMALVNPKQLIAVRAKA